MVEYVAGRQSSPLGSRDRGRARLNISFKSTPPVTQGLPTRLHPLLLATQAGCCEPLGDILDSSGNTRPHHQLRYSATRVGWSLSSAGAICVLPPPEFCQTTLCANQTMPGWQWLSELTFPSLMHQNVFGDFSFSSLCCRSGVISSPVRIPNKLKTNLCILTFRKDWVLELSFFFFFFCYLLLISLPFA